MIYQFHPQPEGVLFGDVLNNELRGAEHFDFATAWVRASGLRHIRARLVEFLGRGGVVNAVVGIDAENTSYEGLRELAELVANFPRCFAAVRHNEAGPIFHPKLYAFRTVQECRVFVGSNNLTEAGLFINDELSLLATTPRGSSLEQEIDNYLSRTFDATDGLVRPLTLQLADQLLALGYVGREATLRGKMGFKTRRTRSSTDRLFGHQAAARPPTPPATQGDAEIEPSPMAPAGDWTRVFVRGRLSRTTQTQIPKRLVRVMRARLGLTPEDGPVEVVVAGSADGLGGKQVILPSGGGGENDPNTYKFEALATKGDLLLRFELVGDILVATKLDGDDPGGAIVSDFIRQGLDTDPPQTFRTRPDESATLWRFA